MPSAAWDDRPLPDEGAPEDSAEGGTGMELKVELSLPNHPTARLDPAIAIKTVRLTPGGAHPSELGLQRETRPAIISIATPEATTDRWCRALPLPRLPVVVREDALVVVGRTRDDGAVLGLDGKVVSVERFGFSAPGDIVMKELGMTADNLVKEAKAYM